MKVLFIIVQVLESLLIPKNVKIEPKAFKHCSNLKIVFVENEGRFNGIKGNNFEGNAHIKTLPDETSMNFYLNCCNENLEYIMEIIIYKKIKNYRVIKWLILQEKKAQQVLIYVKTILIFNY